MSSFVDNKVIVYRQNQVKEKEKEVHCTHELNIPKEAGLLKFLPVSGGRGRVSLCDR